MQCVGYLGENTNAKFKMRWAFFQSQRVLHKKLTHLTHFGIKYHNIKQLRCVSKKCLPHALHALAQLTQAAENKGEAKNPYSFFYMIKLML
jgi:hypothetical protein